MVRFDKPCHRVSGALEYFSEHMQKGDYLTEEGNALMTWQGKGAEKLGLSGVVDPLHFERLCNGQHPFTGDSLSSRHRKVNRRVCYFGQISAPKDVSIAYLVGGDQRIKKWWEESVAETIIEVERLTAARIRKGGVDADRATGNIATAVVTHDSSRSLDPQLHTHLCLMNITYDEAEGQWKSIQPHDIYKHQTFLREVCYNKLAGRMIAAGYELEKVRKIGFTIKGFPDELRDTFSKRRQKILSVAEKLGNYSQEQLNIITLKTREKKQHIGTSELLPLWEAESGLHLEVVRNVIAQANGLTKPQLLLTAHEAMDAAVVHLFERHSVIEEPILLREALIAGRGSVELSGLRRELSRQIASGKLIHARNKIGSKASLEMESSICQWAASGKKLFSRFGLPITDDALTPEQKKAVEKVLGCLDRVVVLQGDAGTGKTTSLRAVVKGIEAAGFSVFACAPSTSAAEVLRQELTPHADTLQQLLCNDSLQGRIKYRVILVDEAGLISVKQMYDLCVLAQQNHNRLILVGDIKQHASVEAGDALRALQKYADVTVARLTEIHRQRDPVYRKAVALLAKGKAYLAIVHLDLMGAIKVVDQPEKLFAAAAKDYVTTLRSGKSCLAISPVWSEIHQFTDEVRIQLKAAGLLDTRETVVTVIGSLQFTAAEKKDVRNYQIGDLITFHRAIGEFQKLETVRVVEKNIDQLVVERESGKTLPFAPSPSNGFDVGFTRLLPVAVGEKLLMRGNYKPAKIQNGDIVEVSGFREDGSLQLKDGRILPPQFRQFTHGYASTSHAAQGKTVDRGIVIMGEEALPAANLKQAYVSNSRFRESQAIYTHDKQAMCEAMSSPADRMLTLEMVRQDAQLQKLFAASDAWEAEQQRLGTSIHPSTGV